MIINTVGKIILENGQKVYKRFGAAVVLKIKLGTAAFASLVNNLATTEEGFALDARVGPLIDERISGLETDVESLNSAIVEEIPVDVDWGTYVGLFFAKTGRIIKVHGRFNNVNLPLTKQITVPEKYAPLIPSYLPVLSNVTMLGASVGINDGNLGINIQTTNTTASYIIFGGTYISKE